MSKLEIIYCARKNRNFIFLYIYTFQEYKRLKEEVCQCVARKMSSNMPVTSASEGALPPQQSSLHAVPQRPKSLMESLLVAKMEQLATNSKVFVRINSVDSTGSISSVTSTSSNICKCDDCLLGIADRYNEIPNRKHSNTHKVCF